MSVSLIRGLGLFDKTNYFPLLPSASPFSYVEFLNTLQFFIFFKFLPPILAANILALFCLIITLTVSFLMFRELSKNNLISILFSIVFSFGNFYLYRVMSFTPNLYQIFIFPLIVYLLYSKKRGPGFLAILIFLFFNYSSYYAYFSLFLVLIWYFLDVFLGKELPFKLRATLAVKRTAKFLICLMVLVLVFSAPLLSQSLPLFEKYRSVSTSKKFNIPLGSYRPIEDFYNLSARPWYFVIPPKTSLYFGDWSETVHQKIEDTGYYLTTNYEERDMGGSYLGWHFLLGAFLVFGLISVKKFFGKNYSHFKNVYKHENLAIRSFLVIFIILFISGPPSFTVGGIEFYTPTYLFYYVFPVFRALVRWSLVIYLFLLIINSFLLMDLFTLMKTKLIRLLFVCTFLMLNYVIFAIDISPLDISQPPSEIAFLRDVSADKFSYAVYPKGDYYSVFWILSHKKKLINPSNSVNYDTGFDSEEFSQSLATIEGIKELSSIGGNYLVFYKDKVDAPDFQDKFFVSNFGSKVYDSPTVAIYKTNGKEPN